MLHPELSPTDILARIEALRFEFSSPGHDLDQFAGGLRHRARSRRAAMVAITAATLVATLVLRRLLTRADACLYGVLALVFAIGSDRSRKEDVAASEVDWLRARLAELSRAGGPPCP